MSDPPDETSGAGAGPSLNSDGTLEGRLNRLELEPASPGRSEPVAEPPLELAEVAPLPIEPMATQHDEPDAKPRVPLYVVFGAFGLGLLILIGALVRDVISPPPAAKADEVRALDSDDGLLRPRVTASQALIQSEPSGASIVVGGQVIGTTPWAGDNTMGTAPIEVRLNGYKTWRGRLPDQADAKLTVHLTR